MFKGTKTPRVLRATHGVVPPNTSLLSAVRFPIHNTWGENHGEQPLDPAWVQLPVPAVWQVPQVSYGPHDVNHSTRPLRFACQQVCVHDLTLLGDGPRVVRKARHGHSMGDPCLLRTPTNSYFQSAVSLGTSIPWTQHNPSASFWHLWSMVGFVLFVETPS